jgi:alpha-mannosidase
LNAQSLLTVTTFLAADMVSLFVVLILLLHCSGGAHAQQQQQQQQQHRPKEEYSPWQSVRKLAADSSAPRVLNVHIVPHTHDDVGWRKTVEQYYYGLNTSIDARGAVNQILSSAVQALTENEARTFTYAEVKFFSMWWHEQNDAIKDTVRYLIANRQWTFVNGGWCMHDEAASHFVGMTDQTTLGHQFLLRELGVRPVTAWQLDPFGHSATQASLLTYAAGMDALYFGRIDYQDLQRRKETRECEGFWNVGGDSSLNATTVFWGLTGSYGGNYGPPAGFCFDVLCNDEPLVGANSTRLLQRVTDFVRAVAVQSHQTRGNHIMLTMGEDFTVSGRVCPNEAFVSILTRCFPSTFSTKRQVSTIPIWIY